MPNVLKYVYGTFSDFQSVSLLLPQPHLVTYSRRNNRVLYVCVCVCVCVCVYMDTTQSCI